GRHRCYHDRGWSRAGLALLHRARRHDVPQGWSEPGADRLRLRRDEGHQGERQGRLADGPAGARALVGADELRRRTSARPLHKPGRRGERRGRCPNQGQVRSDQHSDRRRAVPEQGAGRPGTADPSGDGGAPPRHRRPVDGRADRQGTGDGRRPDALQHCRGHEQDGAGGHLLHDQGSPRQERVHLEHGPTGCRPRPPQRRHRDRRGGTRHRDQAGAGDAGGEDLGSGRRAGEGHRRDGEPDPAGGGGPRPRPEAGRVRQIRAGPEGRGRQGVRDPGERPAAAGHRRAGPDRGGPQAGRDRGSGGGDPAPREGVGGDRAEAGTGGAPADRDAGRSRPSAAGIGGKRQRRGVPTRRAGAGRGYQDSGHGRSRDHPGQGRGGGERDAGPRRGLPGVQPGSRDRQAALRDARDRPRDGRATGQGRQDHRRLHRQRRLRGRHRAEPSHRRHGDNGCPGAGSARRADRRQGRRPDAGGAGVGGIGGRDEWEPSDPLERPSGWRHRAERKAGLGRRRGARSRSDRV
ncbi:MAG: Inner membrane protein YqiK, partial [uncultured Thermomicrobiales bacterium]